MEFKKETRTEASLADRLLEIASWLISVAIWILVLLNYKKLPTTIQSHFDDNGDAITYANKASILWLPIVTTIVFFIIIIVSRNLENFKNIINIQSIKSSNKHASSKKTLRYLKLIVSVIFLLVTILVLENARR